LLDVYVTHSLLAERRFCVKNARVTGTAPKIPEKCTQLMPQCISCFPPAHWIKQCWCWWYIETRFLCFTRLTTTA